MIMSKGGSGTILNDRDITYPAIDGRLCQPLQGPRSITTDLTPDTYTIPLNSVTGMSVGDVIGVFQNSTNPTDYFGVIMSIFELTLTMDTPINKDYLTTLSPQVYSVNCNANIDGSETVQEFSLVNRSSIDIDVVRVMMHLTDGVAMDDAKFGGISALTNGIVLRKKRSDGTYDNYWDRAIKTNGGIGLVAYDREYDPKAPAGVYGLRARYSFAGEDKHGVACRISKDEELQFLVQDDLTDLTSFEIMWQGNLRKS